MSNLLRSMLVLSVASLLVVGCGKKEAAPVEAAPAPVTAAPVAVAPAPVSDTAGGGGYEPTAAERVPGITADAAAPTAEAAPAADPAPAEAAPAAEAPAAK